MIGLKRLLICVAVGCLVSKPGKNPAPRPTPKPKTLFEWDDERLFQWYLSRRSGYSTGARDSYSRYDQTIASVSAGAIVLSITFLKDIGYSPTSIPWLYGSWIAFLFSGGFSLFSLRTSADTDIENLYQLENMCKGAKIDDSKARLLGKQTERLNQASLGFVVTGILLAMIFAVINYSTLGGSRWPNNEVRQPQTVEVHVIMDKLQPETSQNRSQPSQSETPAAPEVSSSRKAAESTTGQRTAMVPKPRTTEEPNGN